MRFDELEFHRSGFGLLPDGKDKEPGTAVYLSAIPGSSTTRNPQLIALR